MFRLLKLLALTCDEIEKNGWISRRTADASNDPRVVATADRVILSYARTKPSKQAYALARGIIAEVRASWGTRTAGYDRRAYLDACRDRLPLREAPFACTIPTAFARDGQTESERAA